MSKSEGAFNLLAQWMEPLRSMEKSAGCTESTVSDPAAAQGTAGKKQTTQATQTSVEKQNLSVNNVPAIKPGESIKPQEGADGGPNVLLAGEKPAGAVKKENEGMNKTARVQNLGRNIMGILTKEAQAMSVDMQKTAAVSQIEKEASEAAGLFQHYYAMGKAQRMQDAMEIQNAGIDANLLSRVGGIEGLLDKAASEDPASVLPPELAGAMPGAEGAAPEGMGGGEDPQAMLDEMAQILDANGVTVDEVQQIMQQVEALKAQGFSEEEIMQSLMEASQAMEQGGMEGAAPEAAPEMEEAPEMEAQKEAASRANVDILRNYFIQTAQR